MAYGKRKPRRKFTRRPQNKWGNALAVAKQALKTATWVAGMVNAESKHFDYTVSAATANYTGTIVTLCEPAQGISDSQREGDSIKMQNLTFRANIARVADDIVRLIIFFDKTNIITTGAMMLENNGTALAVLSGKEEDNKFNSKILYDRTFVLTGANTSNYKIDKVIKINQHVQFAEASTTIKTGALKMLIIGSYANASGNNATYNVVSRCTYLDN